MVFNSINFYKKLFHFCKGRKTAILCKNWIGRLFFLHFLEIHYSEPNKKREQGKRIF
ncbi:hypothetical protein LEP1GSC046_0411 [Leptospira kirschneri serovar Bim str. 1051]|nr:hypothetical protein LEP1GSC042_2084 [Leptospira kirschneri serovar Bim str. PUO 1247]EMN03881.1 hypothetical protein LEP1GSC046_0411 [Leptospira kirschneri serovar Bim str. 1051]EMO81675.1 hypothetical protein LEP1GSC126_0413 [Leptospira kirschneri str. 200801774]